MFKDNPFHKKKLEPPARAVLRWPWRDREVAFKAVEEQGIGE